ncbi:MAG: beta-ketoacyl-ACP reductase [Bdellovibrionota bacterium]
MARFDGQQFFVTGGSRGIGASIVQHLASEGAIVHFTYASQEAKAQEVLNQLPGKGHTCLKLDLSDLDSIEKTCSEFLEKNPGINGIVNNAGFTKDQLFIRTKREDFESVLRVNLTGTFTMCQLFGRYLMKKRQGSIVNLSSVVAHLGNPGQAAYTASKAGVEAMTRTLALELSSRHVRVNCVAPGFIDTDMTHALADNIKQQLVSRIPLERMGTGKDIAAAVAYLLSDESSYITGQVLHVNGGMYLG